MSESEKNNLISNWTNKNRELLLKYQSEWVAYNLSGIVAHDKELKTVRVKADLTKEEYTLFYVPPSFGSLRFLPIRFRNFNIHFWNPLYSVKIKSSETEFQLEMLVDSGADCSLVPLKIGEELGFKLAEAETMQVANGVGGSIEYVLRNVQFTIDGHSFSAPIAWVQNKNCSDTILGREIVFDLFDIEFKQAEEKIIFKKR